MTFVLVAALASNPYQFKYPELLRHVEKVLIAKGFQQRPQLSSSHSFDVKRCFRYYRI